MASQPSERAGVVGTIDPQTVVNSEVFSDVVDMSKFAELMAVFLLGNMANETITATLYYCDSDGGNAVAISGKQLALSASASANDNTQVQMNLKAEEVITTSLQTKRYVKAGLVTGNSSGGPAAVLLLGMNPRFGPASDDDLASNTIVT